MVAAMRDTVSMDSSVSDEEYQERILPHVSRTFALTIPQLPAALRIPVTNAYLLCRIADTIEDGTMSSAAARLGLLQRFVAVLCGEEDAALLTKDLLPRLSEQILPAERDLALNMHRIVRVTASLREQERGAIRRCVELMCGGMHQFQGIASLRGLPGTRDLDEYCYYVAGVVGQMLTELFCAYSPAINLRRSGLEELAVSFAQGLQMTNILKDVWEDHERGACWLPQEVFSRYGVDLEHLSREQQGAGFDAGMRELVGVAHAHLRNALSFTLLIPPEETGIRRFCLWAIGLAVLTLRNIERTPGFTSGAQVKVPRSAVAMTQLLSNFAVRNDWLLRRLFERAAAGLPRARLSAPRAPDRSAVSHAESAAGYSYSASPVRQLGARRGEGSSRR
jgi:farnesyl-diphosphate farnesyltransferase